MVSKIKSASLSVGTGGKILQVKYTQFTGTTEYTMTAQTEKILTDLTVNITPTLANSVIKIETMINGEWSHQNAATDSYWYFLRDSTKLSAPQAGGRGTGIAMGNAISYHVSDADSTPENVSYFYFDSTHNTTSQITYKVAVVSNSGYDWYINRTIDDLNAANYERGISTITATEIAV